MDTNIFITYIYIFQLLRLILVPNDSPDSDFPNLLRWAMKSSSGWPSYQFANPMANRSRSMDIVIYPCIYIYTYIQLHTYLYIYTYISISIHINILHVFCSWYFRRFPRLRLRTQHAEQDRSRSPPGPPRTSPELTDTGLGLRKLPTAQGRRRWTAQGGR